MNEEKHNLQNYCGRLSIVNFLDEQEVNVFIALIKHFLFLLKLSIYFLLAQEIYERSAPLNEICTEFTFAHTLSLELLVQACVEPSDF